MENWGQKNLRRQSKETKLPSTSHFVWLKASHALGENGWRVFICIQALKEFLKNKRNLSLTVWDFTFRQAETSEDYGLCWMRPSQKYNKWASKLFSDQNPESKKNKEIFGFQNHSLWSHQCENRVLLEENMMLVPMMQCSCTLILLTFFAGY